HGARFDDARINAEWKRSWVNRPACDRRAVAREGPQEVEVAHAAIRVPGDPSAPRHGAGHFELAISDPHPPADQPILGMWALESGERQVHSQATRVEETYTRL